MAELRCEAKNCAYNNSQCCCKGEIMVGGMRADVSVESHLLGFSGNLYGCQIRVEFYSFLRDEQKFDRIELLRDQIRADAAQTLRFFDRNPIDPFDYPDWK